MNYKGFFFLLFFFGFIDLVQAQSSTYQLQFDNAPLQEIFEHLETNNQVLFSYRPQDIQNVHSTIHLQTSSLEKVMQTLLLSTLLEFEIVDQTYVLIKAKTSTEVSANSEAPQYKICGRIKDAYTDEALAFANVQIVGTNTGFSTNENGRFEWTYPFAKGEMLSISYVGYQKKVISWESLHKANCPTIVLEYPSYEDEFIIVTDYLSDGVDLVDNGAATRLDLTRVGSLPGQVEPDVLGVAQFLPGISSPGGKASDIYIRGGTPNQNLMIWENIPIYHTAHYFGMISAFNPFIIEEMNVYRGGFGAAYGGRVAGVIDLHSGNEKSKRNYWGAGSNMTHNYLYGHQRLSKKNPASLTFSLRRSFSEFWRSPTFNNITKVNQQGLLLGNMEVEALPDHIQIFDEFNFTDAHLKYAMQLGAKDRIDLAGLFITNDFNDEILDGVRQDGQRDFLDLSNLGFSVNWERNWSKNFRTKLLGMHNAYSYDYRYQLQRFNSDTPRLAGRKLNQIRDSQIQLSAHLKNAKQQSLELGYQLVNYDIEYTIEERSNRSRDIDDDEQAKSLLHTFYASFKNPISRKLGIDLGLRSSYFSTERQFYFEPRFELAYKIHPTISVRSNFGRYYQFINQLSVFRGNDNGISSPIWSLTGQTGVPVLKSDLLQVGVVFEKKGWVIDLQGYYRSIKGISSRAATIELTEEGSKTIVGDTKVRGLDLLVKKRFNKKLRSWVSYSLSNTAFNFRKLMPNEFPANHDQRHILQWTNQINIRPLEIAFGWKYSTGVPYSRIIDFQPLPNSNNNSQEFTLMYDGINNYRLPAIMEFNFSILYHLNSKRSKKWKGYLCLSLANALDAKNINNRSYYLETPDNNPPVIRFLDTASLPITPNMSVRFEW